jgi:hypothetical protein
MVKTGNRVGRGAARMVRIGKTGVEEARRADPFGKDW